MSASSQLGLNTVQHRNEETRVEEYYEDGDFPALTPSYDQRVQAHHKNFWREEVKEIFIAALLGTD